MQFRLQEAVKGALNVLGLGSTVHDFRSRQKYQADLQARARNARFLDQPAPDGQPMPPPELVYLVTGQFDLEAFYDNGVLGAECIQAVLLRNGLDLNSVSAILDFGCGCGRVLRHWKRLRVPKIHGVDYNARLIEWCGRNLTFANFGVNRSKVPLDFSDATFDFIYSISVFTHLTEAAQRFWMDELIRVLKPGGHLLFSVHGVTRVNQLTPQQRAEFEAGNMVIVGSRYSGKNACGTYHPERYVREVLCRDLEFVAFGPGAAKDAKQDTFLMRKFTGDLRG